MSLIHNEQTKLTATAVSNVGTALVIAGFVAPFVSLSLGLSASPLSSAAAVAVSVSWLALGALLHLAARRMLRGLQP